jgi:hypothetical protein
MSSVPDPVVNELYTTARQWCKDEPLEVSNVITFAARLIAATQRLVTEKGRGSYKKQVVLTVLYRLVEEDEELSNDTKQRLRYVLDTTVPPSIDTMVAIGRGEFDLAKTITKVAGSCC